MPDATEYALLGLVAALAFRIGYLAADELAYQLTPSQELLVKIEQCRSCGANVVWVKHETTGKPAPIDAEPVEYGGNVLLNDDGTYRLLKTGEPGPAGGKRHKSHFATCPNHQQHRKAKS